MIPNMLFRVGGAAIALSNRPRDFRRAKYELTHLVRTHRGADDESYQTVFQKEDDAETVGVFLASLFLSAASRDGRGPAAARRGRRRRARGGAAGGAGRGLGALLRAEHLGGRPEGLPRDGGGGLGGGARGLRGRRRALPRVAGRAGLRAGGVPGGALLGDEQGVLRRPRLGGHLRRD